MSSIRNRISGLRDRNREEGQGLAEYALILALVSILCVAALGALQTGIDGAIQSAANAF